MNNDDLIKGLISAYTELKNCLEKEELYLVGLLKDEKEKDYGTKEEFNIWILSQERQIKRVKHAIKSIEQVTNNINNIGGF